MSNQKTNIYIAADDNGLSISGLTNMEYLHILHILKRFVVNADIPKSTVIAEFQSDIQRTALNVLKKGTIVYGPYES